MSNFRNLLKIESSLNTKLNASWNALAVEVWAGVKKAIEKEDWPAAYKAAGDMNVKHVAEHNREWVKHYLFQAAVHGGAVAGGGKSPAVSAGSYDKMLDNVVDTFIAQVEESVTEAAYEKLVQLIADAEKFSKEVQKADSYIEEFTSFSNTGTERMQLISSLHTSRLAAWGGLVECEVIGATEYEIVEQNDARCCAFCDSINGTRFSVQHGSKHVNSVLSTKDPEAIKSLAPFADNSSEFLQSMEGMDPEDLAKLGYSVPPFHPGCRGQIKPVSSSTTIVPSGGGGTEVSEDEFNELGLSASKEALSSWKDSVKAKPSEVLSSLTGVPKDQLVEEKPYEDQRVFSFASDGSLKMKVDGELHKGVNGSLNLVYDPLVGKLYQNYAEFSGAKVDVVDWLAKLYSRIRQLGVKLEVDQFVVRASGADGIYSYAKMGFVPARESEWLNIQRAIEQDIKPGGRLANLFENDEEGLKFVLSLLDSGDPKSLWVLASSRYGQPLLRGRDAQMALKFNDSEAGSLFNMFFS